MAVILNASIMAWSSWMALWQWNMYTPTNGANVTAIVTVSLGPRTATSLRATFSYGSTVSRPPERDRIWKSTRWMWIYEEILAKRNSRCYSLVSYWMTPPRIVILEHPYLCGSALRRRKHSVIDVGEGHAVNHPLVISARH